MVALTVTLAAISNKSDSNKHSNGSSNRNSTGGNSDASIMLY